MQMAREEGSTPAQMQQHRGAESWMIGAESVKALGANHHHVNSTAVQQHILAPPPAEKKKAEKDHGCYITVTTRSHNCYHWLK
jgi:hypothetical protein